MTPSPSTQRIKLIFDISGVCTPNHSETDFILFYFISFYFISWLHCVSPLLTRLPDRSCHVIRLAHLCDVSTATVRICLLCIPRAQVFMLHFLFTPDWQLVRTHTQMHLYIYTYIDLCIYACVCVCVCIRLRTQTSPSSSTWAWRQCYRYHLLQSKYDKLYIYYNPGRPALATARKRYPDAKSLKV